MSEHDRKIKYFGTELSTQDALDFLIDMGSPSDLPCPICSHPDWGLSLSPGEGIFSSVPTIEPGSTEPTRYFHGVYLTECLKCGYIRLHSLARLAEWKKTKSAIGKRTGA